MKIPQFDPPGNVGDFRNDDTLKGEYSRFMSSRFDIAISSVTRFLSNEGGGICQFYNPVTNGRSEPDLPASAGDISWNGFPKRFLSPGPGQPIRFAEAEPTPVVGRARPQDEYLEWFVHRDANRRITRVEFTCEGYDYYEDFLALHAEDALLTLYHQFVSPEVKRDDLFVNGSYNPLNKWNTTHGAMHLTHPANNLFAEVFLAGSATVRRRSNGGEHTSALPLIRCAKFGAENRNSDPNIGIAVNGLAREGRMITLANPVGLYIAAFDDAGLTLDGQPARGFFKIVRGVLPLGLRAVFELPPAAVAAGKTVSDVRSGGGRIEFGGQLAQRVTMNLVGVASVAQDVNNPPVRCGQIEQVSPLAPLALAEAIARPRLLTRTEE